MGLRSEPKIKIKSKITIKRGGKAEIGRTKIFPTQTQDYDYDYEAEGGGTHVQGSSGP
jgi:hypothetical protein